MRFKRLSAFGRGTPPSHSKIALADANRRFTERILPIYPLQAFNMVRINMKTLKPIRTEQDYYEVLAQLVHSYETKHHAVLPRRLR